jgi:hypothetical protein
MAFRFGVMCFGCPCLDAAPHRQVGLPIPPHNRGEPFFRRIKIAQKLTKNKKAAPDSQGGLFGAWLAYRSPRRKTMPAFTFQLFWFEFPVNPPGSNMRV